MYRYFRGHQTFFSQFLELELLDYIVDMDFPGGAASGKGSACQCKRHKRLEFKKKKKKETRVQSLGQEDPLEEGMATPSCLENPVDRGAWRTTIHRVAKSLT